MSVCSLNYLLSSVVSPTYIFSLHITDLAHQAGGFSVTPVIRMVFTVLT